MTKSHAFRFLLPILALLLFTSPLINAADVPNTTAVVDSALGHSLDLKGKVVYVDFWASWCVPCRGSFPWMKKLADMHGKDGLEIVTINLDKDPKAAKKFIDDMKSPFPVVFDSTGTLAERYHLQVMPTSFIYGRDGQLRDRHEGFRPDKTVDVETEIESLLKEEVKK